ncbi:OmpA family protein, partial [Escherichia coli]|nr:OmpA family protein [Escherichia coli]
MRIRNLLIAILTVSSTVAFAQEQRLIKEEGKTVFKPHWFMQVQVGAAHTLGEAKFSDLISPAAAINVGYQFAPAWRARG